MLQHNKLNVLQLLAVGLASFLQGAKLFCYDWQLSGLVVVSPPRILVALNRLSPIMAGRPVSPN